MASRTFPGESVTGDGYSVDWDGSTCRIAVVDGLGHGPEAAEVAQRAGAELAHRPDLTPLDSIVACHEALRGTRGAAMTVARVDLRSLTLDIAGVGNVDARIRQIGRDQRFVPNRGIVGSVLPRIRPIEFALSGDWLLVIHTDGVSDRFGLDAVLGQGGLTPQAIADGILQHYSRLADDALVLVASPTP